MGQVEPQSVNDHGGLDLPFSLDNDRKLLAALQALCTYNEQVVKECHDASHEVCCCVPACRAFCVCAGIQLVGHNIVNLSCCACAGCSSGELTTQSQGGWFPGDSKHISPRRCGLVQVFLDASLL